MVTTIKDGAPYKDFAERLRKLRENAGLTRAQLGEKVGVSGRSIINYENGERIPFGDTCAKMAQTFGITTDELLGVSNPQLEMAKAEALDSMQSTNGRSGAARLEHALNTVGSVLAGGELSETQAQEYIFEMQKMHFLPSSVSGKSIRTNVTRQPSQQKQTKPRQRLMNWTTRSAPLLPVMISK